MEKPKKTKNGKWRVRIAYYENGKRKMKSFTAAKRSEVISAAEEYERTLESRGTYDDLTLSEAYDRYATAKKHTLSPRTYSEYKVAKDRDFPELMQMKLCELTPEIIQTAISECSAKYSPKTVRNKHGHLYAVLKMYRPQLQLNTQLPQAQALEIYVPTSDEVRQVIAAADEWLRVPILLASSGSLRRSEICALTPDDVLEFGVRVNKAAVYNADKEIVIKPPKTKAGNRFCPLPPEVLKEVKAWKHFGITPNKLEKKFQRIKKDLGLKFKFHAFRHYFASELHSQGIPDQYIIKVGGWSSATTLQRIYQHTLRDKEQIYEEKIVNIFTSELTAQNKSENGTKKIINLSS